MLCPALPPRQNLNLLCTRARVCVYGWVWVGGCAGGFVQSIVLRLVCLGQEGWPRIDPLLQLHLQGFGDMRDKGTTLGRGDKNEGRQRLAVN